MSWGGGSKRSWGGSSWGDSDWKSADTGSKQPRSGGYDDWKSGKDWESNSKGGGKGGELSVSKDSLDADLDVYFGRAVKDKSKESLDSQLAPLWRSRHRA